MSFIQQIERVLRNNPDAACLVSMTLAKINSTPTCMLAIRQFALTEHRTPSFGLEEFIPREGYRRDVYQ